MHPSIRFDRCCLLDYFFRDFYSMQYADRNLNFWSFVKTTTILSSCIALELCSKLGALRDREPLLTRYTGIPQNFSQKVSAYILTTVWIRQFNADGSFCHVFMSRTDEGTAKSKFPQSPDQFSSRYRDKSTRQLAPAPRTHLWCDH